MNNNLALIITLLKVLEINTKNVSQALEESIKKIIERRKMDIRPNGKARISCNLTVQKVKDSYMIEELSGIYDLQLILKAAIEELSKAPITISQNPLTND